MHTHGIPICPERV